RAALRNSFAAHFSPSVQASIWIMAAAMMDAEASIDWVRMVLPNLHHWTVDLSKLGLDNPGEVFVSTTEPHGLIDATVHRRAPPPVRGRPPAAARPPARSPGRDRWRGDARAAARDGRGAARPVVARRRAAA